jgi:hypothetical protein
MSSNRIRNASILLLLFLGVPMLLVFWYQFYRPIDVTRGPWQVLDPGQPVEPLKFEVVEEGTGPVVEPGDLIQITLSHHYSGDGKLVQQNSDWWLWIGFRTENETPFYAIQPRLVSAFVGQREGGGVKFMEPRIIRTSEVGWVCINPFGSPSIYVSGKGRNNDRSRRISIPSASAYMELFIKKVFKGQLRYRTTHLYDRTWYQRCR